MDASNVVTMTGILTEGSQKQSAAEFLPEERSLDALMKAMPGCKGCELYCHAIQVVPGRGPEGAKLMLIGEQPGDQEDKRGEPFVGPAGAVLDGALEELRIPRADVYVTNAVKHFKFIQRGKLRLHQTPRAGEVTACRPWLLAEIQAVRPRVVLCLGATASKSILGNSFALMKEHGKERSTAFAEKVYATIHPSAVLRARDAASRAQLKAFLEDDLAKAWMAAKD